MKTKTLVIGCLIFLGLISMSFTTEKETTIISQTDQQELVTNYLILYDDVDDDIISSEMVKITNYPDPFFTTTTIEYELKKTSYVRLYVNNVDGTVTYLVFGLQSRGIYKVPYNTSGKKSGKYVAVLITDYVTVTEEMTKIGFIDHKNHDWIWD